jgi:predicted amidohydrolase
MTDAVAISVAAVGIHRYARVEECGQHVRALAARAATAGSSLLLLPEFLCVGLLWTDGQAGATDNAHVRALYQRVLTPLLPAYRDMLASAAVASRITIAGASFWHERDGHGVNTGFWCRPDGSILTQDKLHPTRPERTIGTVGGDSLALLELQGVKLGMAICYDVQFPEVARAFADSGVEILLVPSLTDRRGYWRVRHCAHARAIENQTFVCVAPLLGNLGIPVDRPIQGHGAALVACPIDNRFALDEGTLAGGRQDLEGLIHVVLDLGTLRRSRASAEIMPLADRRPDLYPALAPPGPARVVRR